MKDKIKILIGLTDNSKDDVLDVLISLCKSEAYEYCNLEGYTSKLDSAVIQMVIEKYNKMGTEGLSSVSTSGIKEEYNSGYSPQVLGLLKKNRKVKCV